MRWCSLVEVDVTQNVVQVFEWRRMRERPVYLVWHANEHSCCWCQLEGKELTLLPYPLSSQPVRRFRMPREASVIGRVTNAWLPLIKSQGGCNFTRLAAESWHENKELVVSLVWIAKFICSGNGPRCRIVKMEHGYDLG